MMNRDRRSARQKREEETRRLKDLRQEMEEELLRQLEAVKSATTEEAAPQAVEVNEAGEEVDLKRIVEALLFASGKPLPVQDMRKVLKQTKPEAIERAAQELKEEYEKENRSFRLQKIAGGWELATDARYASWLRRLELQKKAKHATQSALETLAIIAYKQPLSRVDVEDLRGVDCSGVISTLLEYGLINIVGRKEVPGRPFLYGTTDKFLEHFGLADLKELPNIEDIKTLVEGSVRKENLLRNEKIVENAEAVAQQEPAQPDSEASETTEEAETVSAATAPEVERDQA